MKDLLWDLFNKTGNVNYYLLLSKVRDKDGSKNKRYSNK